MAAKRKTWVGRVHLGAGRYHWVGRFPTRRDRDDAVARAKVERPWEATAPDEQTCGAWVDRYLRRAERELKDSSYDTAAQTLKTFRQDFGDRPLGSVSRVEAEDWVAKVKPSKVPIVVMLFNRALHAGLIETNPFRGLGKRTKGRAKLAPPTDDEFRRLLDGCSALGDYAGMMRALLEFAAYTGTRPGELFALEWSDVDFTANRVHVRRRLYRGRLDLPKSNQERMIALPPPARDALLRLRALPWYEPIDGRVFHSKTGRRLSQPTLSNYWGQVKAAAGLEFDFYLATKHFGVHLLYKLGLSQRAIGAQMGWSEAAVENLLTVYGHVDLIGLAEVDKLYAEKVVALRPVRESGA